jgi:hypothetical protein
MVLLPTWLVLAALATPTEVQVVKFTSASCAPCQAMEPVLEQIAARGFPVRRIDVDQERQLANDYQITSVPTLLLVARGQLVDRIEGALPLEALLPRLEAARAAIAPAATAHVQPAMQPAAPAPQANLGPVSDRSVEQLAFQASVRLRIEDDNGHSFGTGTIIDVHGQDALVLTCGHIFRESQGKGKITVDLFAPGGSGPVAGQLIRFDVDRDLALVGVRTTAKLQPVRVAPVGWQPAVGTPLFSVGCNHGEPPTIMHGRLKAVNKYLGPENLTVEGQPTEGRSGGGLFSPDGVLVGVCNAADPELNEGLYAAFVSVHRHLDDARLSFVYQQQNPSDRSQLASATGPRPATPSESTAPGFPAALPTAGSVRASANVPTGLASDADRWSPSQRPDAPSNARSAAPINAGPMGGAAEVICIVRTRDNPTSPSQVVVLDRPSRDFLSQLNEERRAQVDRQTTQMRSPRAPSQRAGRVSQAPTLDAPPATARFTSDRRLPHPVRAR